MKLFSGTQLHPLDMLLWGVLSPELMNRRTGIHCAALDWILLAKLIFLIFPFRDHQVQKHLRAGVFGEWKIRLLPFTHVKVVFCHSGHAQVVVSHIEHS